MYGSEARWQSKILCNVKNSNFSYRYCNYIFIVIVGLVDYGYDAIRTDMFKVRNYEEIFLLDISIQTRFRGIILIFSSTVLLSL